MGDTTTVGRAAEEAGETQGGFKDLPAPRSHPTYTEVNIRKEETVDSPVVLKKSH